MSRIRWCFILTRTLTPSLTPTPALTLASPLPLRQSRPHTLTITLTVARTLTITLPLAHTITITLPLAHTLTFTPPLVHTQVADVVEALLGSIYLESGWEGARQATAAPHNSHPHSLHFLPPTSYFLHRPSSSRTSSSRPTRRPAGQRRHGPTFLRAPPPPTPCATRQQPSRTPWVWSSVGMPGRACTMR